MLGIQSNNISNKRLFESYQYIMPRLAFKYLHFNYLKMIWKVFYLGRSAIEKATL